VLVVAESRDGALTQLTLELLGLAQQLKRELGGNVVAALIGNRVDAAQVFGARGADRIYSCHETGGDDYVGDVWLPTIEGIAREIEPRAILCGHTTAGADLAPRLAFRLQSGVATACVGVVVESGALLFTRPCYGGNARETVSFRTLPAIATIKAGVGAAISDVSRTGTIVHVTPSAAHRRTRVIAREREQSASTRLEDAKIVVAGGRGLEGPDGFRMLEDLAGVLGAAVGSSRVPCDLGWCPHSWQIGLTGKTVTPDLYFAVGISGAGHHMAGCGNAKTIVAINTDPAAAIFKEARFGIVGDYRKVVPALANAVLALEPNP
jgi:electron transfer flavoprotein alpha subunit